MGRGEAFVYVETPIHGKRASITSVFHCWFDGNNIPILVLRKWDDVKLKPSLT
ncbi:hypothetical protein [Marivirga sp.]|uniref:hypothetical protein n=1 Tax=Marivirga sp. TaxID=2018662 RepID=UPI003DA6DE2A